MRSCYYCSCSVRLFTDQHEKESRNKKWEESNYECEECKDPLFVDLTDGYYCLNKKCKLYGYETADLPIALNRNKFYTMVKKFWRKHGGDKIEAEIEREQKKSQKRWEALLANRKKLKNSNQKNLY